MVEIREMLKQAIRVLNQNAENETNNKNFD